MLSLLSDASKGEEARIGYCEWVCVNLSEIGVENCTTTGM